MFHKWDKYMFASFKPYVFAPSWGDIASVLTHTYPHKPPRKTKVTICNHQADSPLYVWPNVWSGDLQVEKMHGHAWHQMSLLRSGVIKQHKPNPISLHLYFLRREGIQGEYWASYSDYPVLPLLHWLQGNRKSCLTHNEDDLKS